MKLGILAPKEEEISIWLDPEQRTITIEDNGTGIKADDFGRVMSSIADSDKRHTESRGHRGIGRLCGLAYCDTAEFRAKFKGENVVSVMRCSADVMKSWLHDRESGIKRYSLFEIFKEINEFWQEGTDNLDEHYFKVELKGINAENTDLLDDEKVRSYLEFTAPVPYATDFAVFWPEIHRHADSLNFTIDEYKIRLNGEDLFKPYKYSFTTSKGSDEVFELMFKDFVDDEGRLVAWMWVGLSCFEASIKKQCSMWGIRLRQGNIQVGDERTMQSFFKEERGNGYFIGEVFCVSDDLTLTSQLDYFVENKTSRDFASMMKAYCEELGKLYRAGSMLNCSLRRANEAEDSITRLKSLLRKGFFADSDKREEQIEEALEFAMKQHKKETADFEHIASQSDTFRKVADRIKQKHSRSPKETSQESTPITKQKLTQNERKLIDNIFGILTEELGRTASTVIHTIEERLGLK